MINIKHVVLLATPAFLAMTACAKSGLPTVTRYEIRDSHPREVEDGIAFDSKQRIAVSYKQPYTKSYLDEPFDFNSGAFRYSRRDGLIFENITRISLPSDISRLTHWQAFNSNCRATKVEKKYSIACEDGRGIRTYLYSKGSGIEEFDFPCVSRVFCRYKLVSKIGLFAGI